MAKKKTKKSNTKPPQQTIRLSQVMIVKNEEKNIEKALGWAKDIAFEQIVVDTGSADRTVELAERLGAKVVHFEWVKDFSAAKNFAIDQATGDWIAFLDADEYFSPEHAKKLLPILRKLHADPKILAMSNPWVQIDDKGKPIEIHTQERLFRNLPTVRYVGRIHEYLSIDSVSNIIHIDELDIMHTGYTAEAYTDTKKASRNIELLRLELKSKPDDLNLKAYLADSLVIEKDEESMKEADKLYMEVIKGTGSSIAVLRKRAYLNFLNKYVKTTDFIEEHEKLALEAMKLYPGDLDFLVYYAAALSKKGEYHKAIEILSDCEKKLPTANINDANVISANPAFLFGQLVLASQGLGDTQGIIKYATLILVLDKTKDDVLCPYLYTLLKQNPTQEELFEVLSKIYDMKNAADLMLITRAAMSIGAIDLARTVMNMAGNIM
ncbi:MAG: glycosyltransferase [Oscillospiraceae bacterium]|nr:glycosyltransferase [Oscillospiraceae bacterium]